MILSSRSLGSDKDDEDSDKSLEDIDDHDTVEMIDTFDDIDDNDDRDDRQLVFRRPLRPRFPVVNPAAAALIPAIPTFVGIRIQLYFRLPLPNSECLKYSLTKKLRIALISRFLLEW